MGAAAGAVIGAVAGGAGGKAGAEKLNPTHASDLGRLIDYTVVDRSGNKVGTVDSVWEDHTGQPLYLAVRTGWLHVGKAHVVPAQQADVSEANRRIRLPYEAERIKNAPAFDCKADLSGDSETTIRDYFNIKAREKQPPAAGREEARVQLKEEEVKIGKREIEYGGVRLRKIVRTETVNKPVELKREEIVIERTPVTGSAENQKFEGEEIYVPLRREEPVVEKSVKATDVGKRTEIDRQEVSETVRKEDVEIEHEAESKPGNRR